MDITIQAGCGTETLYPWDTVWNNTTFSGDWALAGSSETRNRGGLQATSMFETIVEIQLFTNKRCPANHPLAKYAGGDLGGWWGDGVLAPGEQPIGSLLWLLERFVASADAVMWAQAFSQDALSTFVTQGLVVSTTSVAELVGTNGLSLTAAMYGRDGAKVYDRKWDDIYRQLAAGSAR